MPHASDWLLTAPIPGLGLSMHSDNFRTALKFRLGMPLFDPDLKCPASSAKTGEFAVRSWTSTATTLFAAIMVRPACFGTIKSGIFLVTQPKLQGFRRW